MSQHLTVQTIRTSNSLLSVMLCLLYPRDVASAAAGCPWLLRTQGASHDFSLPRHLLSTCCRLRTVATTGYKEGGWYSGNPHRRSSATSTTSYSSSFPGKKWRQPSHKRFILAPSFKLKIGQLHGLASDRNSRWLWQSLG